MREKMLALMLMYVYIMFFDRTLALIYLSFFKKIALIQSSNTSSLS